MSYQAEIILFHSQKQANSPANMARSRRVRDVRMRMIVRPVSAHTYVDAMFQIMSIHYYNISLSHTFTYTFKKVLYY